MTQPKAQWEDQVRGSINTAVLNATNVQEVKEVEDVLIEYLHQVVAQAIAEERGKMIQLINELLEDWKRDDPEHDSGQLSLMQLRKLLTPSTEQT